MKLFPLRTNPKLGPFGTSGPFDTEFVAAPEKRLENLVDPFGLDSVYTIGKLQAVNSNLIWI